MLMEDNHTFTIYFDNASSHLHFFIASPPSTKIHVFNTEKERKLVPIIISITKSKQSTPLSQGAVARQDPAQTQVEETRRR